MSDWRHQAACLDTEPDLHFPIGNTGPALLQIEKAKAVCRRCDVVETCLRWALDSGQSNGVWGGLSEDERRALKRRNARARVAENRSEQPAPAPQKDTTRRDLVAVGDVKAALVAEYDRAGTWPAVGERLGVEHETLQRIARSARKYVTRETYDRIVAGFLRAGVAA